MIKYSKYIIDEFSKNNNIFSFDNIFPGDGNIAIQDSNGYEAKIICDSINKYGSRLTTITATYPRFVHSELMTHREFSRNAASSRAIPISKVIEQVQNNPAMPYRWQVNIKGMQGGTELTEEQCNEGIYQWNIARDSAVNSVSNLQLLGAHKQICNRLLEPFVWMTTIISSTNWNNFFHLRCNDLADPTIRHIAEMIRFVIENNEPNSLVNEQWHLPFISKEDWTGKRDLSDAFEVLNSVRKISVARCARVSYLNHESKNIEKDLELALTLEHNGHWSAFEHVACPTPWWNVELDAINVLGGNFHNSWKQYRKTFESEYVK